MSTGGSTSKLSSCGCCQGMPALSAVTNRAGLKAIAYRIGNYGVFFEQMLDQIHSVTVPDIQSPQNPTPLSILTTRSQDDPSIALLDAWAVVADILTFYQERIANEGYLRTATERRSVLELARAIGFELSPGVSASVYLQFNVEEIIGAPTPAISIPGVRLQSAAGPGSAAFNSGVVSVPAGTQVQSVPAPGGLPQTFETSADFEVASPVELAHPPAIPHSRHRPVRRQALPSRHVHKLRAREVPPASNRRRLSAEPPDDPRPIAQTSARGPD